MRKIFLPLLLVALSPVAHSEGVREVEIDAPLSGWHPAKGGDASFSQTINYLALSVNMANDQNVSTQIRGKIENYATAGRVQQGRLVVNGASIPQGARSDGSFTRPYIFTEGSNSVQVINPDRQSWQKMQFYSTPGVGAIHVCLRLVLSWSTGNTDLDFHVVTPDGEHAWCGNTVLKDNGTLDMDVTTGYDPEVFAIPAPVHDHYQMYINYYSGRNEAELTTTQLTLITDEKSVSKKRETFIVPAHNAGELTLVKNFDW